MAQADCANGRYTDYALFDSVVVTTAVAYGSNTGTSGGLQTLRMDVYEPFGDTLSLRPVVLVGFGGSFVGGTRADVAPLCQGFAKLGYVAIAFDYRVGFFWPSELTTTKAVMRCAHDIRGCVRYLRKTVAEDSNPYHIDPERIIAGGVSAGAIGAVHATYLDQASEIPEVLWPDTAFLGGVEGNSGSPGYSSDVVACYSFSGAIGDTSWIVPGDQPLCSVHETGDQVVPCWTEEVLLLGLPTGLTASGSGDIHRRMDHIGVPNCLTIYPGTGHVGYLDYDAEVSLDRVVQFLADVVCAGPVGCEPMFVGVGSGEVARTFSVHPNPTEDSFTIEGLSPGTLSILDLSGAEVMKVQMTAGRTNVDISRLNAGIYLLQVHGLIPRVERLIKL